MELQFANDVIVKDEFLSFARKVRPFIDILEVGTPVIMENGMSIVEEAREEFKDCLILADTKIVDAGYLEAKMAFDRGASIVTVLAVASLKTISQSMRAAHETGGSIMLDTIELSDFEEFAARVSPLSPGYVCLHTPADVSGVGETFHMADYTRKIGIIRRLLPRTKVAIAGGISLANIHYLLPLKPDVIVSGRAICEATDPADMASRIVDRLAMR